MNGVCNELQSQFKDCNTKLTNKLSNISKEIFILSPGLCPRDMNWRVLADKKFNFSEHGHLAYLNEADGE